MKELPLRRIEETEEPGALVDLLLQAGKGKLSGRLREKIVEQGEKAVGPLLALVQDEELQMSDAPGEGWAPIHAVELLVELGAKEATEPLLTLLTQTDPDTYLHDRVISVLPGLGEAVLTPALSLYERTEDEELRRSLVFILSKLGCKDERILQSLLTELGKTPDFAATCLAQYGDEAALPHLHRAFDAFPLEKGEDNFLVNQMLIELKAAIEDLGGELIKSQKEKYRLGMEDRDRFRRSLGFDEEPGTPREARRAHKIGRNEPCWCGSGKKYKKCHLDADTQQR